MADSTVSRPGNVRIGISGWTYAPWRGVFYPAELTSKKELAYAAAQFRSIEINGTFYALQRPESFLRWKAETPDDFVFSIKAPRYITHLRRLKEVEGPVANFLASGLLHLGPKLGPILWQFPPNFRFDPQRIEAFFRLLPHDTDAAATLAGCHEPRMQGRAWTKTDAARPLRHAMEIRHSSFIVPAFIELLRAYGVALVCADTVEWPRLMDLTADFVYCRMHGPEVLYASGYDDAALDTWAGRVRDWAQGGEPSDAARVIAAPGDRRAARDVFVYFDNDIKVRAPSDAQGLASRVTHLLGA